jgi:hypothetical protein
MNDEYGIAVRYSDPDGLAGSSCEQLRPRERPGAQLIEIEVAVRELEQLRPELILVTVRVLLHEPMVMQRAEEPVDRALRKAEAVRELADAEPPGARGEGPEDPGGTIDGLNHRDSIVEWRSAL